MNSAAAPHEVWGSPAKWSARETPGGRPATPPLSPPLASSLEATATRHFEVYHEPDASYVGTAGEALEDAYRHFYEVFTRAGFHLSRPKERLVWICFPQKNAFDQYALRVEGMDLSWLDGYYSTLTNRVAIVQTDSMPVAPQANAVPPGTADPVAVAANRAPVEGGSFGSTAGPRLDVTRLTHEVAHQLAFNSGIQKRGVMYPLWVSEGLATNFEFELPAASGLERLNTARSSGLLQAYAAGELTPLREFVVQTTVPPDASAGRRYYAQAWGFFHFALNEHPESLRAYLRRLAQDRPTRRGADALLAEFTAAFGTPESLEVSWNAFLAHLAWQTAANRLAGLAPSFPAVAR